MFKVTMLKPGAYVDPQSGLKILHGQTVEVNKMTPKMRKVAAAGGLLVEEFKGEKAKKPAPKKADDETKPEGDTPPADETPPDPPKGAQSTVSTADVKPAPNAGKKIVLPPRKLQGE